MTTSQAASHAGFGGRLAALTKKECLQLRRDNSSLLMGIVLPFILVLLVGFGMSLDVKHVPTAVVLEDSSPLAQRLASFTQGSEYFAPVFVRQRREAEALMDAGEVDAMLLVPQDFSRRWQQGEAQVQLILNGVESTTATSAQSYVQAAVLSWAAAQAAGQGGVGQATLVSRIRYNDANTSTWFFVPGILMLVLTICGVFLTAVVMAREWERGTLEAIFVTPLQISELIIAKVLPYFVIAFLGLLLALGASACFYDLPVRGALPVLLLVSMLYLLVTLGIGLVISAVTKNQFLACQVALLISFLPSVMLSGFIFDMHSEPVFIQVVSRFFPATWYLEMLRSLCLSGTYWPLLLKNSLVLLGFAVFFLGLAFRLTKKEVA